MSDKKLIINVGRQFGSGGRLIAGELGKKLGIPVYDNELITKAAEASGFSSDLFRDKDEKRSIFPVSFSFSTQLFGTPRNFLNEEALFEIQSSVIREIGEKESAVIVGRCADYILRDRGNTLDIFVTAPEDVRISRISERTGISSEKAREMMTASDRKRETYYNYFTFGNWGVASNYDLCLDSSILGIEGSADFIIEFAAKAGLI